MHQVVTQMYRDVGQQNIKISPEFFIYFMKFVKNTGYTQRNDAVSKVNKFISHLTRSQRTPSAAATVRVSHALIIILQCVHPGSHIESQIWTPQNGAHRKPFPAATPSWKLAQRPRSKHEKRTAGSA